jgi:hypothetical protein
MFAWDTVSSSAETLRPEAIQDKAGWQPITTNAPGHVFDGDAVITNGRVLAVARKQGKGVDLYTLGSGKPVWRAHLSLAPGQQDEMVGECRWVVKALRQKAGILMATDPRLAPVAAEVRSRCQKMLRGGAAYEGARH